MRIKCNGCNAKFEIADEKIPKKKIVRIICPKCQSKIKIEPENMEEDPFLEEGITEEIGIDEDSGAGGIDVSSSDDIDDSPFEYFEGEKKVALICVSDTVRLERVKGAIEDLDMHMSVADSVKMGLSRLRYNQYDVVVLDENFCGEKLEKNTILHYLQPMPMFQRRHIFLVLLSEELRTFDNLAAFILSTNMIVNYRDLNKFSILLKRGLKENERFYKTFNDCLRELGKS